MNKVRGLNLLTNIRYELTKGDNFIILCKGDYFLQ